MPIYQYLCPSCELEFELKQSFTDKAKVKCPRCNNGAKRLFSPVPIIFKGSGFYVTDNSAKSEAQFSAKEVAKEAKEVVKEDKKENKEEKSEQPAQ